MDVTYQNVTMFYTNAFLHLPHIHFIYIYIYIMEPPVKWPEMPHQNATNYAITMTSWWPRWRLKSPASRLFTQPFIQTQIKENIKAPRHWPLCGEFTGPVNSPHIGPATRKMFPFDDVIMPFHWQHCQHWYTFACHGLSANRCLNQRRLFVDWTIEQ